jgi:glycine oxidase
VRDVIVIGGGAIGLAIARELASRKLSVLVIERDAPGQGASRAAAGMLAPQSEATSPGPFFDLTMASLAMYDAWAASLREETGVDPEFSRSGALCLAAAAEDLEKLERSFQWQRGEGFALETLTATEVLKLEPNITMPVAGALWLPNEQQVTPRRLTRALGESCVARDVEIRAGQRVDAILTSAGRAEGVSVAGARIHAGQVIVASGVWSPEIAGLDPAIPVQPRKGQILSLAMPDGLFSHMLRWAHAYAVPRPATGGGGELIVGATNEDAGFDRRLTPAGVGGLLTEAQRLSARTAACPIVEMWTGLRPATPDEWPIIGPSNIEGLLYATGHYRNGILLAPITASIVAALVTRGKPPLPLEPFSPSRFG